MGVPQSFSPETIKAGAFYSAYVSFCTSSQWGSSSVSSKAAIQVSSNVFQLYSATLTSTIWHYPLFKTVMLLSSVWLYTTVIDIPVKMSINKGYLSSSNSAAGLPTFIQTARLQTQGCVLYRVLLERQLQSYKDNWFFSFPLQKKIYIMLIAPLNSMQLVSVTYKRHGMDGEGGNEGTLCRAVVHNGLLD